MVNLLRKSKWAPPCLVVILAYFSYQYFLGKQIQRVLVNEEFMPDIAWFMSFPNSGTTYTQRLVQVVTRLSVASNYGHELIQNNGNVAKTDDSSVNSVPVIDGAVNGPFRTSLHLPVPWSGYLLTKTHCGGYCFSDCPPNWYRLSPLKFIKECSLGVRHDVDDKPKETWLNYDYHLVKRIVHLIRNPFDNIVSRFFHEVKMNLRQENEEWLKQYPKTPLGFRAWCDDNDRRWQYHEKNVWGTEIHNATIGVPCHGELIRYVRWHNNVFTVRDAMKLPSMTLHYDDFDHDFSKTLQKLLKFLQQRAVTKPVPFLNSVHDEFYIAYDVFKMSEFIRFIASKETLQHLERYLVKDLVTAQEKAIARNQRQGELKFYNVRRRPVIDKVISTDSIRQAPNTGSIPQSKTSSEPIREVNTPATELNTLGTQSNPQVGTPSTQSNPQVDTPATLSTIDLNHEESTLGIQSNPQVNTPPNELNHEVTTLSTQSNHQVMTPPTELNHEESALGTQSNHQVNTPPNELNREVSNLVTQSNTQVNTPPYELNHEVSTLGTQSNPQMNTSPYELNHEVSNLVTQSNPQVNTPPTELNREVSTLGTHSNPPVNTSPYELNREVTILSTQSNPQLKTPATDSNPPVNTLHTDSQLDASITRTMPDSIIDFTSTESDSKMKKDWSNHFDMTYTLGFLEN